MAPVTFFLTTGGSLLVRVKDQKGQSLINKEIMVHGKGRWGDVKQGSTDDEGECLFKHLQEGEVSITVSNQGIGSDFETNYFKESNVVNGRTTELEIIVKEGYVIYGIIMGNGKPMSKCTVRADSNLSYSDGISGTVKTNGNGLYRIENMESGEYTVTVSSNNPEDKWMRFASRKIKVLDKDVELNFSFSFGVITGTVTDFAGNPIEEAFVNLRELDNSSSYDHLFNYHAAGSRTTDSNGKYEIKNVNSGKYRLTVSKDGYAWMSRIIEKGDEFFIEENFKLDSPAAITGKVLTEDGVHVKRIILTLLTEMERARAAALARLHARRGVQHQRRRLPRPRGPAPEARSGQRPRRGRRPGRVTARMSEPRLVRSLRMRRLALRLAQHLAPEDQGRCRRKHAACDSAWRGGSR